jgi:hypothetical protein
MVARFSPKAKTRGGQSRGFSFWLAASFFVPIQPFADDVNHNTHHDRDK